MGKECNADNTALRNDNPREKNMALLIEAKKGNEEAANKLVESNMGLVKSIALRFRDRGTEFEDLVQIGSIGMIKAIKSFDFSYNTTFSTYAVPLIIGEIRRYLRDEGMIKVGRRLKKQGAEILRAREEFERQHGREPRISELSEITGFDTEEIVYSLDAVTPVKSLSESVSSTDGNLTLENILSDGEETLEKLTDNIALSDVIYKLPETQRKILYLRYYRELSQQKTGEILGISQVKVSREEKKILDGLKKAL